MQCLGFIIKRFKHHRLPRHFGFVRSWRVLAAPTLFCITSRINLQQLFYSSVWLFGLLHFDVPIIASTLAARLITLWHVDTRFFRTIKLSLMSMRSLESSDIWFRLILQTQSTIQSTVLWNTKKLLSQSWVSAADTCCTEAHHLDFRPLTSPSPASLTMDTYHVILTQLWICAVTNQHSAPHPSSNPVVFYPNLSTFTANYRLRCWSLIKLSIYLVYTPICYEVIWGPVE